MGIVNVADFERCAVAVQTAGTERRETALMRKLREGVDLIHELRQLGGTEELLDRGDHGTGVDKVGGHYDLHILQAHALAYDALEAGQTDADLVLQKLADAPDAAVAEMVDIVGPADAVGQTDQVADGRDHIGGQYVTGRKLKRVLLDVIAEILIIRHVGALREDALQGGIIDVLVHAEGAEYLIVLGVIVGEPQIEVGIDELVAEDLDLLVELVVGVDPYAEYAGVLDREGSFAVDEIAFLNEYLAGVGIDDGLCRVLVLDTGGDGELLVVLIPADAGKIVPLVKEEGVEERPCALLRGGLAGTEPLVDLDKTIGGIVSAGILLKGLHEALFLAHELDDRSVGAVAQRP